ncbi:MAG: RraA family protein [Rhizobiales bacterium]|nr:RraA family protein [Hyphomicrobiales bacterium]
MNAVANRIAAAPATAEGTATRPKSAEMTPGPGFRIRRDIERPAPELVALLGEFETPDISDTLNRLYTMSHDIHNVVNAAALAGPACTVKVFPGDNLMVHKALDVARPGDVIVIDTSGSPRNAVLGDLVATKAKHRGIAGFIVDGLVRDLPALRDLGLPIYARGVTPFGPLHRGPGELNYAVSCGGIVVNPGDIVVADQSGIAVVRREVAAETLNRLLAHRARLQQYVVDVKAGKFSNEWVDRQLMADNCLVE